MLNTSNTSDIISPVPTVISDQREYQFPEDERVFLRSRVRPKWSLALCFSHRCVCGSAHTHSHTLKSYVIPAELSPYSQTPAPDQKRQDEHGIATAPPAISLLPCLLLVCLSSTEIIPEPWESAKSCKTNVDTPNAEGFLLSCRGFWSQTNPKSMPGANCKRESYTGGTNHLLRAPQRRQHTCAHVNF